MKKIFALFLSAALSLSLASCGGGSTSTNSSASVNSSASGATNDNLYANLSPVELILADGGAVGAAGPTFDQMVADKVGEITGGKLTIETFLNGELGGDVDMLRQSRNGEIDLVGCQMAPLVSFVPEVSVFDLPMVFATVDGDRIDAVLNGDSQTRAALNTAYEAAGWHLLGFLQNATFRLTTSNRPLTSLADFEKLSIRTMENQNHMAFWEAIGAEPVPMAWNEVYFALQTGNIAAQENAADTILGANLQDVQDHLSRTNHILYLNQICINKDSWDELDPAYQAALEQAVAESISEMRQELIRIDNENTEKLSEQGMTVTEYDDAFFEEILSMPAVKELYQKIDTDTNGLASTLQEELNQSA